MYHAPVRILSWNVQGGKVDGEHAFHNRIEAIQQTFMDIEADIFGLQEVIRSNFSPLKEVHPRHQFVPGEFLDWTREENEYLPLGWKSDRFSNHGTGTVWHSPTPNIQSRGWDARYARGFSWALLSDHHASQHLLVIVTHFDHLGIFSREQSAQNLLNFLEDQPEDRPVILLGDFNCGPYRHHPQAPYNQRPYAMLLGAGFIDAYRVIDPSWPPPNTFHKYLGAKFTKHSDPYAWMIDFILVRNMGIVHAAIHRFDDESIYPSDHYPVYADLKYLT